MKQGIKFANNPFDVRRCPDRNLLFSTDFMGMPIIAEGSVSKMLSANQDTTVTLFEHNLGYYPVFMCYTVYDGKSYFSTKQSLGQYLTLHFRATKNAINLHYVSDAAFDPDSYTFYLYVFATPLEQNIESKTYNNNYAVPPGNLGRSGLVVSKKQMVIDNNIGKNKIISTNYPSFTIHKQVNDYSATNFVVEGHDLGYPPMFLAFAQGSDTFGTFEPRDYYQSHSLAPQSAFEFVGSLADSDEIKMYGVGTLSGFNYSIIIFKGAGQE